MTFALLYLLATIDGVLLGHHAAIGQNPLVDKGGYWLRSFARGLLCGQVGLAIIGATVAVVLWTSPDRSALLDDSARAGRAMLRFYLPYAGVLLSALTLYATPWRVLANVLVLGPFTLLRVPVLAAGIVAGMLAGGRWEISVILGVALGTVGMMRPVLRRLTPRGDWLTPDRRSLRSGSRSSP